MLIKEILSETAESMQAINRWSQEIVNYFNQHPEMVKSGTRVPLDQIVKSTGKDPALDATRQAVEIVIEPMAEFELDANGRWQNKMNQGAYYRQFVSPNDIDPKTNSPRTVSGSGADEIARGDRWWAKQGTSQDAIPYHVSQGHKTSIHLPAEVITRSYETARTPDNKKITPSLAQHTADRYIRGILSTISHELNHAYNSFQGMDMGSYRQKVDKNKKIADNQPEIQKLLANAEDSEFLNKNIGIVANKDTPQIVKDLYWNSRELIENQKNLEIYQAVVADQEQKLADYEQKVKAGQTGYSQEELDKLKQVQEKRKARVEEVIKDIKTLKGKQKQLKQQVARIKPDPKLPTSYYGDAYYTNPVEINSRLQQASLDMAKEIKPGMTSQAISELIQKAFGDHQITVEFIQPDKMKTFRIPGETADREFKSLFQTPEQWNKLSPQFKQEAFASALTDPKFKRYVNRAYQFIQAEQANPTQATANKATLGQRFKAAIIGIPQSEINNTILPSAKDAVVSGVRQATTKGSPLHNNIIANTVAASKRLDTPAALKTLEVGGKVLIAAGIVTEVYRGLEQIKALPDTLNDEQYQTEVEKIIAKLVAEFGLVYVGALAGAWLSGLAMTALLPGLGTVAGAVVGFIAGGAAGYFALEFAGDSVRSIAEHIVKVMNKSRKSTNTNNTPIQKENLDRILELSAVKKPT
jgi:hypothetical protein